MTDDLTDEQIQQTLERVELFRAGRGAPIMVLEGEDIEAMCTYIDRLESIVQTVTSFASTEVRH